MARFARNWSEPERARHLPYSTTVVQNLPDIIIIIMGRMRMRMHIIIMNVTGTCSYWILRTLATSKRYNPTAVCRYSAIIGLFKYSVPSGTHKQAVIHQQIKTKNDLVPQRAAVQQELS